MVKRSVLVSVAAARRAERTLVRFQQLNTMTGTQLMSVLKRDPRDAHPWVRAAAIHGVVEAQLRFGGMLLEGNGVQQDRAAACRWFLRAAQAGNAEAMNMAGRCYENGWGVPTNERKAADWYRRSAECGHDWAEYNYAHMLFDGRGGVRPDRIAAFTLYRRAARRGHVRAMNLVARCLEAGWGVPADPDEAADWYRRSAEAGYFRAQFNHAAILARRGEIAEAMIWLDRARNGGDDAMSDHVRSALAVLDAVLRDRGRDEVARQAVAAATLSLLRNHRQQALSVRRLVHTE
jgi:TPR repeat protein